MPSVCSIYLDVRTKLVAVLPRRHSLSVPTKCLSINALGDWYCFFNLSFCDACHSRYQRPNALMMCSSKRIVRSLFIVCVHTMNTEKSSNFVVPVLNSLDLTRPCNQIRLVIRQPLRQTSRLPRSLLCCSIVRSKTNARRTGDSVLKGIHNTIA
jgi:hypothetical protein